MRKNPIRAARQGLGLTQVELAKKAGISQFVISHLEQGGAVGRKTAPKIERALGGAVDQAWLLGLNRSVTKRGGAR